MTGGGGSGGRIVLTCTDAAISAPNNLDMDASGGLSGTRDPTIRSAAGTIMTECTPSVSDQTIIVDAKCNATGCNASSTGPTVLRNGLPGTMHGLEVRNSGSIIFSHGVASPSGSRIGVSFRYAVCTSTVPLASRADWCSITVTDQIFDVPTQSYVNGWTVSFGTLQSVTLSIGYNQSLAVGMLSSGIVLVTAEDAVSLFMSALDANVGSLIDTTITLGSLSRFVAGHRLRFVGDSVVIDDYSNADLQLAQLGPLSLVDENGTMLDAMGFAQRLPGPHLQWRSCNNASAANYDPRVSGGGTCYFLLPIQYNPVVRRVDILRIRDVWPAVPSA